MTVQIPESLVLADTALVLSPNLVQYFLVMSNKKFIHDSIN